MASLTLDDYSPNEQRGQIVRDYSLIVEYKALDYLSLLNGFSLDPLVYVVLFSITGIAAGASVLSLGPLINRFNCSD